MPFCTTETRSSESISRVACGFVALQSQLSVSLSPRLLPACSAPKALLYRCQLRARPLISRVRHICCKVTVSPSHTSSVLNPSSNPLCLPSAAPSLASAALLVARYRSATTLKTSSLRIPGFSRRTAGDVTCGRVGCRRGGDAENERRRKISHERGQRFLEGGRESWEDEMISTHGQELLPSTLLGRRPSHNLGLAVSVDLGEARATGTALSGWVDGARVAREAEMECDGAK